MSGRKFFERACARAIRIWPVDTKRARDSRRRLVNRARSLEVEVFREEQVAQFAPQGAGERLVAAQRVERLRKQLDRRMRIIEQRAFNQALEYSRLDVTLDSVLRLGLLVAIGVAISAIGVLVVAIEMGLPPFPLLLLAVVTMVAPIAGYGLIASYPEAHARRLRVASLGAAPEAVNYMAMSMRVVPALDRAVEFASQHTEEPLASRLGHLLWNVYLRSPPGIEAAFLRFANEWGEWQEDVKRAFFAIGSASLEQTEAGLDRTLEKARQIAFGGTKARIMEYAAGLRGPTTVLFALGVLLPVIIGAMLPLISLGGVAPSLSEVNRGSQGRDLTVAIVLVMDVLFPAGAVAYAYRILGNRPGTGAAPDSGGVPDRRYGIAAIPLIGVATATLVQAPNSVGVFVSLWLTVAAGVLYLLPGLRDLEKKKRELAQVEMEFPDALFVLGSRIAEGAPVERALAMTAEATQGTAVAALLQRIVRALQTCRGDLQEILFSRDGILREVPSRTIRAAFRMVIEVSRKDPAAAGKTITETSTYLRDLRDLDRDIRRDLSSVVDAMQTTAAFFAPIVLGVTCSLYGLLTRAFSRLVVLGLSPASFVAVVGIYLILAVAVITYFRVGIAHGRDLVDLRTHLVRAWPISMAVFTGAFLVSELGLVA